MRSKHQIPTIPISVSLQHIIIHQETEQAHEDITVVVVYVVMSPPKIIIFRRESSTFFSDKSLNINHKTCLKIKARVFIHLIG